MAIAGAVVLPVQREMEDQIVQKLSSLKEVKIEGIGEKGIAVVLETASMEEIRHISEQISHWEEVVGFHVVYVNWEELGKYED